MINETIEKWDEFRKKIKEIRSKYGYHEIEITDGNTYKAKNVVLFRGQGNSSWPLQTTLERKSEITFDVEKYMLYAAGCVNEIESFTGKSWDISSYPEIKNEISNIQDSFRVHLPFYDHLVYLRHHGFPSPLLDWTESPNIAAFFAFQDSSNNDTCVSIYCYIDSTTGVRGGTGGASMISIQGPYVSTHPRHFSQKAWYTVATRWDYESEKHYFCPHETVFSRDNPEQDLLIKINIPNAERINALEELSDYNINPFTLFQSEDSLIKAMEIKEFDLKRLQQSSFGGWKNNVPAEERR